MAQAPGAVDRQPSALGSLNADARAAVFLAAALYGMIYLIVWARSFPRPLKGMHRYPGEKPVHQVC